MINKKLYKDLLLETDYYIYYTFNDILCLENDYMHFNTYHITLDSRYVIRHQ